MSRCDRRLIALGPDRQPGGCQFMTRSHSCRSWPSKQRTLSLHDGPRAPRPPSRTSRGKEPRRRSARPSRCADRDGGTSSLARAGTRISGLPVEKARDEVWLPDTPSPHPRGLPSQRDRTRRPPVPSKPLTSQNTQLPRPLHPLDKFT